MFHVILHMHMAKIPYLFSRKSFFFSPVVLLRKIISVSICSVVYFDFTFQAFEEDDIRETLDQEDL